MLKALLACLLVFLLATAGCGTLFNEKIETIQVLSQTPGASVAVDGMPAGRTPIQVQVTANRDHMIVVTTADGRSFSCPVNSGIGAVWLVLDIVVFYTILPLIIDAVTSNWNDLSTTSCYAPL